MISESFDNSAKAFYRQLFKDWGMTVETERVVFSRERTIDLVVTCTNSDQQRLQTTVFAHLKRFNAIELKGINDPLTEMDYNRIMMRAWGLGALKEKSESNSAKDIDIAEEAVELELNSTENIDNDDTLDKETDENQLNRRLSQRTVTIVCVTKPVKILHQLKNEYQFVKTDEDGIYHCQERLSQWIICPSELALVPKNYPLLPLAKGKKLEQFISLCFQQGLFDYLRLIMDIGRYTDPDVILQKILEVQNMEPQISDRTWAYVDQVFRKTPEIMWKIPVLRDALVESQEIAEQRAVQRGVQQGVQQGVQKTLIRQLRRKFTSIPDSVVQKIEATSDIEQLDIWFDQVIAANSLADTGLISSKSKQ
jgi:hypothetical protein